MSNEIIATASPVFQLDISNSVTELLPIQVADNFLEVEIIDAQELPLEFNITQNVLQIMQGDIYFANNDLSPPTLVNKTAFNVTSNDTRIFNLPADARVLLMVVINQIDYEPYCSINPIGSGRVVYTPPGGGYTTEIGDRVTIYWQK